MSSYIPWRFYCGSLIIDFLGQMYVADERFKFNIGKYGGGTAEFVSKAIEIYCKGCIL